MQQVWTTHRQFLRIGLACSIAVALFGGMNAHGAGEYAGQWSLTVDFQGQEIPAEMTLTAKDDGTYKGVLSSMQGDMEIETITIVDGKMTFSTEVDAQGTMMEISFEATFEGDKLSGTIMSDLGEMDVTGSRMAEPDYAGDWTITLDFGGTPLPGKLTLVASDDGTYKGVLSSIQGNTEIETITIEGGKVSFEAEVDMQGTPMKISFVGKIDGDSLSGVLSSDMGDMNLTGERAKPEGGIVGTWKLTSESALGTLERDLVINADMTGKYITDDNEFDIENLTVDGENVSFDLTLDVQGQEMALNFQGKLDGDSLAGEFFADGSSVAQVTASRAGAGPGDVSAFVGSWDLDADSAIGPMKQKLTVNEDGSAAFSSDGVDSDVTNLRVEGDQLKFNVSIQGYDLEFAGGIVEGQLKGDYLMGGDSVAQVVGKKAE